MIVKVCRRRTPPPPLCGSTAEAASVVARQGLRVRLFPGVRVQHWISGRLSSKLEQAVSSDGLQLSVVSRRTLRKSLASCSLLVVYAPLQEGQQEECPPTWQDLVAVHHAVERRRPLEQSEVDCIDMRDAERGRQTEHITTHHCVRRAIGSRHGHRVLRCS
eukprot:scaffold125357_cov69-Phaeocystis_antarctica.AAC.4